MLVPTFSSSSAIQTPKNSNNVWSQRSFEHFRILLQRVSVVLRFGIVHIRRRIGSVEVFLNVGVSVVIVILCSIGSVLRIKPVPFLPCVRNTATACSKRASRWKRIFPLSKNIKWSKLIKSTKGLLLDAINGLCGTYPILYFHVRAVRRSKERRF